jgi:hypothetical protein
LRYRPEGEASSGVRRLHEFCQRNDLDRIDAGHAGGPRHPPDRFTPVDLEDSIGVTRLLLSTDEPHLAGRDGRLQLVHVDSVELYGDAVILVGFL